MFGLEKKDKKWGTSSLDRARMDLKDPKAKYPKDGLKKLSYPKGYAKAKLKDGVKVPKTKIGKMEDEETY